MLLSACVGNSYTTLSYSEAFGLHLPTNELLQSTVFTTEQLGVALPEGKVISGFIINNSKLSLPNDFNIQTYPEYIVDLKPIDELPADAQEIFINTKTDIDFIYGLGNLDVSEQNGRTIYSLCTDSYCMAYVVKPEILDHILAIQSRGITIEEFKKLLESV